MSTQDTMTVVLADDDAHVRTALRELLDSADGIEVVAAVGSAREAVAACTAHVPDVAVLDVRMPGGGLSAARDITAAGIPTRVVVLTADDTPAVRREAAASGAARFVAKSAGVDLVRTLRDVAHDPPGASPAS